MCTLSVKNASILGNKSVRFNKADELGFAQDAKNDIGVSAIFLPDIYGENNRF
jgi:hypothetical protein